MEVLCLICCDNMKSTCKICGTLCGHVFHCTCLEEWLKISNTCPQCRSHLKEGDVRAIFLSFSDGENVLSENCFMEETTERTLSNLRCRLHDLLTRLVQSDQLIKESNEKITNLTELLELKTESLINLEVRCSQQDVSLNHKSDLIEDLLMERDNFSDRIAELSMKLKNERRNFKVKFITADLEKNALIERVIKLEKKMEIECEKMFPGTKDSAEFMKKVADMKSELESSKILCADLQARLVKLNKNVKSKENTMNSKDVKNESKDKKAKASDKLKGNTRAPRAPLGAIGQNKENPLQTCRYNLRPR